MGLKSRPVITTFCFESSPMLVRSNSLLRNRTRTISNEYQTIPAGQPSDEITLLGGMRVHKETFGELLICASLVFFGVSFTFQKQAMINGMQPISYNAFRYLVSTVFLGGYLSIAKTEILHNEASLIARTKDIESGQRSTAEDTRRLLLLWGSLLAVANIGGSILQQIGLVTVTAGKTGFITGMYVIFVPIAEYFFPSFHTKLHWSSLAAALISIAGLFLLSGCAEQETCFGGAIKEGEVIVFVSMLFWVASIMFADLASKQLDGVWIVFVEFAITTVATFLIALYFEPAEWVYPFVHAQENWDMIVTVGFTEAMAFGLCTLGQTYSSPTRAALLFSLEAVVCGVGAFLYLGETLTWIEIFGGFLMFIAAVGASLVAETDEEEEEKKDGDEDRKPIFAHHEGFGSMQ